MSTNQGYQKIKNQESFMSEEPCFSVKNDPIIITENFPEKILGEISIRI